ncbi:MAG: glycosyltransferase, partial [Tidjanibacter sp.]|nr:glycosyltransferase [Tidjanibacter sp.]
MKINIVILNWNGRKMLAEYLPKVVATLPDGVRLTVADNGSEDDSPVWLAENYPEVERLVLDRNYGYAGGYRRALEMLSDDVFVLLNSDVAPAPGWVESLVASFADERVAAVAPKILSVAEPQRFEYAGASGGFIDLFGYPFCRGRILATVEYDEGQYDSPRSVF